MNSEFKKALRKVVQSETDAEKSSVSKGVKIATKTRVIQLIVLKPFSK